MMVMHSDRTMHITKSALAPMNKFACKLHGYIVYLPILDLYVEQFSRERADTNTQAELISYPRTVMRDIKNAT